MQTDEPSRVPACMQANFTNAKLHNADWTRSLIGEYPSLVHDSPVKAVAVHGTITVTGCSDGKVRIWKDDQVQSMTCSECSVLQCKQLIESVRVM